MRINTGFVPLVMAAAILVGCTNNTDIQTTENEIDQSSEIREESEVADDLATDDGNADTAMADEAKENEAKEDEAKEDEAKEDGTVVSDSETDDAVTDDDSSSQANGETAMKHLTVDENIDVSYVKDADAAAIFKDFLQNKITAQRDGSEIYLEDMLIAQIDDYDYDSESETMTEYLVGNCAICYCISEVDEPVLYVEIMNLMVEGIVYQLKIKDGALYVNSVVSTGGSDSVSVYPNGLIGLYHGMHLPMIQYYYDGRDSLIDVYDNSNKVKLIVVGPKNYFDTGFEEAKAEYEAQAETVLFFEDELSGEICAQRDEILGIAADDDLIIWKFVGVVDFEE